MGGAVDNVCPINGRKRRESLLLRDGLGDDEGGSNYREP